MCCFKEVPTDSLGHQSECTPSLCMLFRLRDDVNICVADMPLLAQLTYVYVWSDYMSMLRKLSVYGMSDSSAFTPNHSSVHISTLYRYHDGKDCPRLPGQPRQRQDAGLVSRVRHCLCRSVGCLSIFLVICRSCLVSFISFFQVTVLVNFCH